MSADIEMIASPLDPNLEVTPEQAKQFVTFLGDNKLLIADDSQSVRSNLCKTVLEFGLKSKQVLLASTFEEAKTHVRDSSPQVVVADYLIGGQPALELISIHRESYDKVENRLFVLVTGNTAEAAVAEAAEEEVDAYILKPFTGASIRHYLAKAAMAKSTPTPYRKELIRGKLLMESQNWSEAYDRFTAAKLMHPAPAMACYYQGTCQEKLGQTDLAERSYMEGLAFKEMHYKCLAALFDFYSAQDRPKEAYEIMRRLAKNFPISPIRLTRTIELAVRTQNFEDIGAHYQVFTKLDERREDLRKCVSAALVVGAVFQLRRDQQSVALDMFQKAAATAGGSTVILREIVMILAKFGVAEKAESFLKRFPPETFLGSDYRASALAVLNLTGKAEEVIAAGRRLLREGIQDPAVHRILIAREREYGHTTEAETLLVEATTIWPAEAKAFDRAMAGGNGSS